MILKSNTLLININCGFHIAFTFTCLYIRRVMKNEIAQFNSWWWPVAINSSGSRM